MKQLSLLPLMHQFDKDGFMKDTTFFENGDSEIYDCYIVFNTKTFSMLVRERNDKWLEDIVEAETVIITKGNYNGKSDCFEIMFLEEGTPLHTMIIPEEQFEFATPLKEGRYGRLDIFLGGLYRYINSFSEVYYRIA